MTPSRGARPAPPAGASAAALALAAALILTGPALPVAAQETPPAPQPPGGDEPLDMRGWYDRAMAAYQRKDYLGYLENIQKALALAPDRPILIYRMAGASALVGNAAEALAQMQRLVDMKVYQDFSVADFDALRGSPPFEALVAKLRDLKSRVGTSETAFHLTEKDLITEGLARDPRSEDFFVGSVHKRKILRVSRRGKATGFTSGGQDGLWAVLGMTVDAGRRTLWACSTAVPQMVQARPEDLGRAALFQYNVDTGALIAKYPLGGGAPGHNCNDLTLDAAGAVWVSDSESGEILTLPPGAPALAVAVPAGQLRSPQGLAFSGDGRHLFIADYGSGLWRMETSTRTLAAVPGPHAVCLLGIDGLVFWQGGLIAVQNGIQPHRVVRLKLDAAMAAVESGSILEMGNALFDEPTLGVLTDRQFYYVANSQWSRFEKDGSIYPLNRLAEPVILRLKLDAIEPRRD